MSSSPYTILISKGLKHIYSLEENYYLREQFTEKQYEFMRRMSYYALKKWYRQINYPFDIKNTDIFNIFKINFDNTVEQITSCNCIEGENSYPFHITILDNSLLCNFISHESLLNKIFSNEKRYASFLVDLKTEAIEAGHNCLFVIDKLKTECYVIDSNGSLDYFNDLIDTHDVSYFLHKSFEDYASSIGFKYINLLERNINLKINVKIDSPKQAEFFRGYCKGWSLYFQYLLFKCDDNFDILGYITLMSSFIAFYSGTINELIEIFQVWLYHCVYDK